MTDAEAIERFQALYAGQHRRVYAYAVSMAGRQLADEERAKRTAVTR